jgi:hypothetical protein
MKDKEYFENTKGKGVLATADDQGIVDAALYAKPFFVDDNTVVFIMADRLSHENLKSNGHAAYLFMEDENILKGRRLYLTKIREDKNTELIDELRRLRNYASQDRIYEEDSFLVYFSIDKVLPLIGHGE